MVEYTKYVIKNLDNSYQKTLKATTLSIDEAKTFNTVKDAKRFMLGMSIETQKVIVTYTEVDDD